MTTETANLLPIGVASNDASVTLNKNVAWTFTNANTAYIDPTEDRYVPNPTGIKDSNEGTVVIRHSTNTVSFAPEYTFANNVPTAIGTDPTAASVIRFERLNGANVIYSHTVATWQPTPQEDPIREITNHPDPGVHDYNWTAGSPAYSVDARATTDGGGLLITSTDSFTLAGNPSQDGEERLKLAVDIPAGGTLNVVATKNTVQESSTNFAGLSAGEGFNALLPVMETVVPADNIDFVFTYSGTGSVLIDFASLRTTESAGGEPTPTPPTPQGYGVAATGARTAATRRLEIVTEPLGSGPGTLAAAIAAGPGAVIIFERGMKIVVDNPIVIPQDTTILGHGVSDGGGVEITSNFSTPGSYSLMRPGGNNIIMRHLRLRGTQIDLAAASGVDIDTFAFIGGDDIWLDHCSFAMGTDSNLDMGDAGSTNRIEISNCFFAYAVDGHTEGGHRLNTLIGNGVDKVTFYRCLWGAAQDRCPKNSEGTKIQVVNCGIFDNNRHHDQGREIDGRTSTSDVVANLFMRDTNLWGGNELYEIDVPGNTLGVDLWPEDNPVYISKNLGWNRPNQSHADGTTCPQVNPSPSAHRDRIVASAHCTDSALDYTQAETDIGDTTSDDLTTCNLHALLTTTGVTGPGCRAGGLDAIDEDFRSNFVARTGRPGGITVPSVIGGVPTPSPGTPLSGLPANPTDVGAGGFLVIENWLQDQHDI